MRVSRTQKNPNSSAKAPARTTGLLMKKLAVPFVLAFPAAGVLAGAFALLFGFFCVRLTRIYFAMLTLAFAQIVWAICFKWNEVTGGEQGMPEIPYPDFSWLERLGAAGPAGAGAGAPGGHTFLPPAPGAACPSVPP